MDSVDLELYKRAFRNTANPTLITDENYVIRDVNRACVEFTGYPREELVGNPPTMLFSDPGVYEEVIDRLEGGDPWQGYFETETREGHLIYGQGSAIPLVVDGEKRGYSGIFVDLTERRQYERGLQVIYRVLRHDLRNEMNLLVGYLDALREDGADPELIAGMEGAVDRLLRRADKARSLEELLNRGFEQPRERTRLDAAVEATVERIRERFPEAEVVVGDLPACEVVADSLLPTVIESVVENAIVHNDGTPRVEIAVERDDDGVAVIVADDGPGVPDDGAAVIVADDGPGVPDDRKEQIFGREEVDELNHGEGFSLYFVDCVVDLYRGSIEVRDNDLGGATFELRLPRA